MLFLNGDLYEEVYMDIPPSCQKQGDNHNTKMVCRLQQASRQWNIKFTDVLIGFGFKKSKSDYSLFYKGQSNSFVAVLLYVDDIVVAGPQKVIMVVKEKLHKKFKLKDLGALKYFLGLESARSNSGIHLSQR